MNIAQKISICIITGFWLNQFGAIYYEYHRDNKIPEPYADSMFFSKSYVTELSDSLQARNVRRGTHLKGTILVSTFFYEFVLYFFIVILFACWWWETRLKNKRLGWILLVFLLYSVLQSGFYLFNRNTSISANFMLILLTCVWIVQFAWPIKDKNSFVIDIDDH